MVTRSEQPISRFPGISGALRKALLPILHTCSRLPQTAPEFFRRVWNEQRHWLVPLVPFLFLLYRPIRLAWGTWFGAGSPLTIQAFVPLLAVYLAWEQRHTYAAAYRDFHLMLPAGSKHRRGTIWPLLFSCLLMLVAAVAIVPSLIVLAFVLMVISVIYYVFGWFVLRMLWAPLTFLLLMTPPGNLIFHV
ncbi:MAG: archaeosortase/exosortase family protein, partial [Capsulimonadales bacterium]|nr:archaeosortase/exosortase family protein [Capsulimonadales bacterium]